MDTMNAEKYTPALASQHARAGDRAKHDFSTEEKPRDCHALFLLDNEIMRRHPLPPFV